MNVVYIVYMYIYVYITLVGDKHLLQMRANVLLFYCTDLK